MKLALLALASLRFYQRHPWQLVLAVAGIALGIAVFVGIELANNSARRAFESSTAAVRGQTTHRLLPLAGMLDESVYLELKRDPRFVASAPVLELPATLRIADSPPIELTLRGIDPVEEVAVRGLVDVAGYAGSGAADLTRLMTEPGAALLPADLAARFGIAIGPASPSASATRSPAVPTAVRARSPSSARPKHLPPANSRSLSTLHRRRRLPACRAR